MKGVRKDLAGFGRFLGVSIAAIAMALGGPCAAQASRDFSAFPAAPYAGPRHRPDFTGPARRYLSFRTAISEGFATGDRFAGHYVIFGIGCGTDCTSYTVGDLVNGRIYNFPFDGEAYYRLAVDVRPSSRLVKAQWMPEDNLEVCVHAELAWTGRFFQQLGRRTTAGPCIRER